MALMQAHECVLRQGGTDTSTQWPVNYLTQRGHYQKPATIKADYIISAIHDTHGKQPGFTSIRKQGNSELLSTSWSKLKCLYKQLNVVPIATHIPYKSDCKCHDFNSVEPDHVDPPNFLKFFKNWTHQILFFKIQILSAL